MHLSSRQLAICRFDSNVGQTKCSVVYSVLDLLPAVLHARFLCVDAWNREVSPLLIVLFQSLFELVDPLLIVCHHI